MKHLRGKLRRKTRTRVKILLRKARFRLSVFRSHRYLYAQIIDDQKGETKAAVSTNKTEQAETAGRLLAAKAAKLGIKKVVFDRGSYQFHGRLKALAEGARKGGLDF